MPAIKSFRSLACLRLNDCQITDDGLRHLQGLTRLSILELNGTQISDAGLKHLSGLLEMTDLKLADTRITGRGFVELRNMARLRRLDLAGTQITNQTLSNLSEFPTLHNIEFLYLPKTKVTDAGLTHVAKLSGLKGIVLDGNKITSAGLKHLAVLKNLHWVNSAGGRISEAAAFQFAAGRKRSFSLNYTTAPGQPRRKVSGQPEAIADKPIARPFEQLRHKDDRLTQASIAQIVARGPRVVAPLLAELRKSSLFGVEHVLHKLGPGINCLLYTSPSPRDATLSRMPSSA